MSRLMIAAAGVPIAVGLGVGIILALEAIAFAIPLGWRLAAYTLSCFVMKTLADRMCADLMRLVLTGKRA